VSRAAPRAGWGAAAVDVLDLAHPEHDQPTLGEVVGDDFLYVANSLWGAWDREGHLVEGRKLTPPVILRISRRDVVR